MRLKDFVLGLIEYAKREGRTVSVRGNKMTLGSISVVLEDGLEEADTIEISDEEQVWEEEDSQGHYLVYYNYDSGEQYVFSSKEEAERIYKKILNNVKNVYVYKRRSS